MHVRPLPLNVIWVFSQKDLKPTNSTFRSLSKISPFMASAVVRWAVQKRKCLGRDGFRFLGRVGTATKSLKGRLAVAQPPGATMAVTGN
jgi:hypothetical protein